MLHQPDTDVLFPPRIIPSLRNLRGYKWQHLINFLGQHQSENHPDILAFSLMMIRLNSCMTCHSDSFRAMRGCTACSQQIIIRYKGDDDELIQCWEDARQEIKLRLTDKGLIPKPEKLIPVSIIVNPAVQTSS